MLLLQECIISIHSNEHTSIRRTYLYPMPIIMLFTIERMHLLSIPMKRFLFKQYTCYSNVSKHVPIQSGQCFILFQRICFYWKNIYIYMYIYMYIYIYMNKKYIYIHTNSIQLIIQRGWSLTSPQRVPSRACYAKEVDPTTTIYCISCRPCRPGCRSC